MSNITVTIAGKTYRMACDEGQEARLSTLAVRLDKLIGDLRSSFGEIGDLRLILMAAITILDEFEDLETKLKKLEAENNHLRNTKIAELQQRLMDMAARIDMLAKKVASNKQ